MTKLGAKSFPLRSGTMTTTLYWTPPGLRLGEQPADADQVLARVLGDHCHHLLHVRQHVERLRPAPLNRADIDSRAQEMSLAWRRAASSPP
jgi:hypothetical protein